MLKNYLKIAWRNMIRNKAFSAINILGLALGIASSLLIFLWIHDELSIDAYHENGDVLYTVMRRAIQDGRIDTYPHGPALLPDELKKQFPQVVHAAGFTSGQAQMTFAAGDKINKEKGCWAGADWFKMFSVPLLAGTKETALNSPNSLAISRKVAENYFGSPDAALGQHIRIDNQTDYQVTAVFENLPAASSKKYDFLLNWQDFINRNEWTKDWSNNGPQTFIQLRPDANAAQLQAKLGPFLRNYNQDVGAALDVQLFLQAYKDGYLYSNFKNGQQAGGRIEYLRLFTVVALFLLLIACINFMNLATARSVKRAREVGIRKVVGAARGLLAGQFMGEALLFTVLALIVALVMIVLILPAFNIVTGKNIHLPFTSGLFWLALLGIALVTGFIAGSYPALFLSSLNPVSVLKGRLKFGSGARIFRQGLVVFQFVLSMLLIIGTLIIYRQVRFVQSKNLGYDRENLIYVPLEGALTKKYDAFKAELLHTRGIQSASSMGEFPTGIYSNTVSFNWRGKDPNVNIVFTQTWVGYDFAKTVKVQIAGRDFSPQYGTDTINYLINEPAARRMGFSDPVGEQLTMWGRTGKIIGVVKDFHFQSLYTPISPLVLRLYPNPDGGNMLIRTQPGKTQEALAGLEAVWKKFNPSFPLTYAFADQDYQKIYRSETVIGSLANYFAVIAIFISCLGLLGLSAFTAEQRTKEIGVRKVLGASVSNVIIMFSKDFLKLVMIAIVLASPIAWYAMDRWLEKFAYHVNIGWWVFTLAGLLAIGIALLTVSFHSVKVALMNPAKSLRLE